MPLDLIIVRGAREHNLKDITVEIPRDMMRDLRWGVAQAWLMH